MIFDNKENVTLKLDLFERIFPLIRQVNSYKFSILCIQAEPTKKETLFSVVFPVRRVILGACSSPRRSRLPLRTRTQKAVADSDEDDERNFLLISNESPRFVHACEC
jgi:hypothetical protein